MATKAKSALINAFLKLVESEEFDKITVTGLVEECKISRQTFYYHFDDIEKMLEWSFDSECDALCRLISEGKFKETIEDISDYFNRFDTMLRKASVSSKFFNVYNLLYGMFCRLVETYFTVRKGRTAISTEDGKFLISCSASALCGLIVSEIRKEKSDYPALFGKITAGIKATNK